MRRTLKILLPLSLCLLFAASMAMAEPPGDDPGRGGFGGGMFGFLDDESRDAVRDAIKESMTQAYPAMQLLKAREAELNVLMFTENPDESAIQAKINEITELQAELYAQRIQLRREIYSITGMPVPDMDRGFGPGFRRSSGQDRMPPRGDGPGSNEPPM